MYILYIEEKVVAICEELEPISKYIEQFGNYFENMKSYEVYFERNRLESSKLFVKYSHLYLHPLTDDIALTDMEISYYSEELRKMYMNNKVMIAQAYLNMKMMSFDSNEYRLNEEFIDMMYSKFTSYESFLSSLDRDMLIRNYFVNPYFVKENISEFIR